MIRTLCCHGSGYWLMTKGLSKGRFTGWPAGQRALSNASARELRIILSGATWVLIGRRCRYITSGQRQYRTCICASLYYDYPEFSKVMLSTHASSMTVASAQRPEAKQKKATTAECSSLRFADMTEGGLDALIERIEQTKTHSLALCTTDYELLLGAILMLAMRRCWSLATRTTLTPLTT